MRAAVTDLANSPATIVVATTAAWGPRRMNVKSRDSKLKTIGHGC
jgi:hypothetical protein